jgi:hypothetical protein
VAEQRQLSQQSIQHDPRPIERDSQWWGTDSLGCEVGPYDSEYAVRLWHELPLIKVRGDDDAA